MTRETITWHGRTLNVIRERYQNNGRTALILIDDEHPGEPYMVATTNLVDTELGEDEVAIKNYSENKGVLDALIQAEVIEPPHGHIPSNFVVFPICTLIDKSAPADIFG